MALNCVVLRPATLSNRKLNKSSINKILHQMDNPCPLIVLINNNGLDIEVLWLSPIVPLDLDGNKYILTENQLASQISIYEWVNNYLYLDDIYIEIAKANNLKLFFLVDFFEYLKNTALRNTNEIFWKFSKELQQLYVNCYKSNKSKKSRQINKLRIKINLTVIPYTDFLQKEFDTQSVIDFIQSL